MILRKLAGRRWPVRFLSDAAGATAVPALPQQVDHALKIRLAISRARFCWGVTDAIRVLKANTSLPDPPLAGAIIDDLLRGIGDDWKLAVALFEWARSHPWFRHSPYACFRVVDLLGKMRQFDTMLNVLHSISVHEGLDTAVVAASMRRLAGAGRWKEVVALFDALESLGLSRDAPMMNTLLDTLCKEGRPDMARVVFLALCPHVKPDAFTFNIFVHGWCAIRRMDEALWTVQEMRKHGVEPSVITYSTILQAYCDHRDFARAHELLAKMMSVGCAPNVITYTTFMNSLAKHRRLDEALAFSRQVRSSGCELDTPFYNSLIHILGKACQLPEVWHVFESEMPDKGVTRNLVTYNAMVAVLCFNGREQEAMAVLRTMEESLFKPDLQTFRPVLRLYLERKDPAERIMSVVAAMTEKHDLCLDCDMYTLLIRGLCRTGDVSSACRLFEQMVGREIAPKRGTIRMLIRKAEANNMLGEAERVRAAADQLIPANRRY